MLDPPAALSCKELEASMLNLFMRTVFDYYAENNLRVVQPHIQTKGDVSFIIKPKFASKCKHYTSILNIWFSCCLNLFVLDLSILTTKKFYYQRENIESVIPNREWAVEYCILFLESAKQCRRDFD